ncbi:MAG: HAD hydrolase-like protein [Acidobacteriaceae bacterium]
MKAIQQRGNLQRPWDAYDAYLFDIDGTLLQCADAVHYFAFCDTLTHLAGRPLNLDGVVAHGNTDVGILRDALHRAGIPEAEWRPRLSEARERMATFVEREKDGFCVNLLPSVTAVLHHLRTRGAILGVATGNLESIGKLKLKQCGLDVYFDFGGFSDSFEYRADVFAAALWTARDRAGAEATVCVVGDTPADVVAAHTNKLDVIAVATGIYSVEQLLAEQPSLCVSSLEQLLHLD